MITAAGRSPSTHPDLRQALLETAERLLRERGARALTTREIAREAGCSEGALYVHFRDKQALLSAVCELWIPDLAVTLGSMVERVGSATVRENLEEIAGAALRAYDGLVPSLQAIAGDADLLRHHRAAMQAAGKGPQRGVHAIAAYLAAEQRLGRVRAGADPEMAANLLLAACFTRCSVRAHFGADAVPVDDAAYAAGVASLVSRAIEAGVTT